MNGARIRELAHEWLREQFHVDGAGSEMDKALQALLRKAVVEALGPASDEMMEAAFATRSECSMCIGSVFTVHDIWTAMAQARRGEAEG